MDDIKMHRENYDSSGGNEVFLSYDDSHDKIFGFLRLRKPSAMAHRSEVTSNTCIVGTINMDDIKMHRENYDSSGGNEVFLSYDDSHDKIFGFLRLRKPSSGAHRSEVTSNTCIVRELHVYGRSLKIGERENDTIQHSGLGKNLMGEAEKISMEEFDSKRLLVISAVGTREYYRKLGYTQLGPYMSKDLK
ncbi:histone acetyltransferase, ELP3 family [Candidatus Nitrosotalea sp. FS]|nr:histone acetyltransferase, ELP3 family [Candidatus Nitrosotalea sp. FS]